VVTFGIYYDFLGIVPGIEAEAGVTMHGLGHNLFLHLGAPAT
jgi:hypothetical protein